MNLNLTNTINLMKNIWTFQAQLDILKMQF